MSTTASALSGCCAGGAVRGRKRGAERLCVQLHKLTSPLSIHSAVVFGENLHSPTLACSPGLCMRIGPNKAIKWNTHRSAFYTRNKEGRADEGESGVCFPSRVKTRERGNGEGRARAFYSSERFLRSATGGFYDPGTHAGGNWSDKREEGTTQAGPVLKRGERGGKSIQFESKRGVF